MSRTRDLIRAHRLAIERARALDSLAGNLTQPDPVLDLADKASETETKAERDAWLDVRYSHAPENAADLAALAVHFGQVIAEFDHDVDRGSETFEAFEALRSACLALAGRGMLP